jgi:hypothetical protein
MVWGAYASPRVSFGVSPNTVFRQDAGNCARGRVRSPKRSTLQTVRDSHPNRFWLLSLKQLT